MAGISLSQRQSALVSESILSACVGECDTPVAQVNEHGPRPNQEDEGLLSKSASGARFSSTARADVAIARQPTARRGRSFERIARDRIVASRFGSRGDATLAPRARGQEGTSRNER